MLTATYREKKKGLNPRSTFKCRNFSIRAPIAAPFTVTRPPCRALRFYRNNFIGSN
ncbi:uncharacterized protein DS421_3g70520 [Arachis hypogaea]|nr:uncharacterized protein DS421_3g70520 [Arachis hypogaea]